MIKVITKTRLGIFVLALGVFLAACSSSSPHVRNYMVPVVHSMSVGQVANNVIHDFDNLNFAGECNYVPLTAKSKCLGQAYLAQAFMKSSKQSAIHINLVPDGVTVQGSKALAFFTGKFCQGASCTAVTQQQESQLKHQSFTALYAQAVKASQSTSSSSSSGGPSGPAVLPMELVGGHWYLLYVGLS